MAKQQIISIISAAGWSAVIAAQGDDGQWKAETLPLVCFGLVEDGGGERSVTGFDAGDYIDDAEANDNFLGYISAGQDVRDWDDAARQYGEQRRRKAG